MRSTKVYILIKDSVAKQSKNFLLKLTLRGSTPGERMKKIGVDGPLSS